MFKKNTEIFFESRRRFCKGKKVFFENNEVKKKDIFENKKSLQSQKSFFESKKKFKKCKIFFEIKKVCTHEHIFFQSK